jgi:hypothetical protein
MTTDKCTILRGLARVTNWTKDLIAGIISPALVPPM